MTKDKDSGLPTWAQVAIALIGSGVLTTIITAILQRPANQPPEAVITVDHPLSSDPENSVLTSSTNNIITVYDRAQVKLNSLQSNDGEGTTQYEATWYIDEIQVGEGFILTTEPLEAREIVYTVRLAVKDRQGAKDDTYLRIKVIKPVDAYVGSEETGVPLVETEETDVPFVGAEETEANSSNKQSEETASYRWESANKNQIPENALITGYEYANGRRDNPLYLCRAEYGGTRIIGKVAPSGQCDIPLYQIKAGNIVDDETRRVQGISEFEVLIPGANWDWVSYNGNDYPDNIVPVDDDIQNPICRAEYGQKNTEGVLREGNHPGMVDLSINKCMFSWGDRAGNLYEYELLVIEP